MIEKIAKGARHPRLAARYVNKQTTRAFWKSHSSVTRSIYDRKDPKITERDFDNLLLLDACRYDLFEKSNSLPGELDRYYSVASRTSEFIKKTFKIENENFPEIVCVTATPKYHEQNATDCFHEMINVWEDGWDSDLNTVPPDVMNKRVREVYQKYPNKRILAHYIQPHIPFIGELGNKIQSDFKFSNVMGEKEVPHVWKRLRSGDLDPDLVWQAYQENHEIITSEIKPMLHELEGKNVVTSDHGNAFGTWGVYGHPAERHLKELIEVPWLEYENGKRKEIKKGSLSSERSDVDNEIVTDRLSNLGYVDT